MTIEVPPNMVPAVEAFIAEVIGNEKDPVEIEACRRIALVSLVQRGLRASIEMKKKGKKK